MSVTWKKLLKTVLAESASMIRKMLSIISTSTQVSKRWQASFGGILKHNLYKKSITIAIMIIIIAINIKIRHY